MTPQLSSPFKVGLFVAALLLVVLLGLFDFYLGIEIPLSPFYLVPIALCAWFIGPRAGYIVCLLSVMVYLVSHLNAKFDYSHSGIPYLNTGARALFFFLVAFILAEVRELLRRETSFARTDALTGIANRRNFYERADWELSAARRYQRPLSLAMLDVDGFKGFNDREGHLAGDRVLMEVAGVMRGSLRSTDGIARFGGDEFVLLLPEADSATAKVAVNKILGKLGEVARRNSWPIGFSVGVVTFIHLPDSVDHMVGVADRAMYSVKRSGGNRVEYEVIE